MSAVANPARGEAALVIGGEILRIWPSFAALVAAEGEIGPLLVLIDRAAEGRLTLSDVEALLWHCLERPAGLHRARLGEALLAEGINAVLPAVRTILRQLLAGTS